MISEKWLVEQKPGVEVTSSICLPYRWVFLSLNMLEISNVSLSAVCLWLICHSAEISPSSRISTLLSKPV